MLMRRLRAIERGDFSKANEIIPYLATSASGAWAWLTSQPSYEDWMTPSKIGKHKVSDRDELVWNIDHIIPFGAPGAAGKGNPLTDDELRERLHYTNLQPLRSTENAYKSSKIAKTTE